LFNVDAGKKFVPKSAEGSGSEGGVGRGGWGFKIEVGEEEQVGFEDRQKRGKSQGN
jgi:hypothetical protein